MQNSKMPAVGCIYQAIYIYRLRFVSLLHSSMREGRFLDKKRFFALKSALLLQFGYEIII